VMDELNRMSRLVNDLLLLAKAERADFLNPKLEELDWLTEELYLKARALESRDWRLVQGLSPDCGRSSAFDSGGNEPGSNAVRHTHNGDTITLGSSVRDECAISGCATEKGLHRKTKTNFERFVRATNCDYQFEGAGLGLSIVQAIAQLTAVGSSRPSWIYFHNRDSRNFSRTLPPMNRILIEDNPASPPFWKLGCGHTGSRPQSLKQARSGLYGSGAEFDLLFWTWDLTLMD